MSIHCMYMDNFLTGFESLFQLRLSSVIECLSWVVSEHTIDAVIINPIVLL